ncbi:dermonecrotic toxin domain-containing protein [Pseudomonas guariconensis]|uniref:dermonecrotic toxin domain-containing protein n=1 Tax=Pseudomonas guariconensis TaxID=1288410 RepID=UPI001E621A4B|nr:DUF6543 domain-containing protein [Pseudomonas guariconensis]
MDGEQDSQGVNETVLLQAERAFQDGFIVERLPQWMKSATPQQVSRLGEAMSESIALRSGLKRVLGRIDALDDFIKSKLQTVLRMRYSAQFNLHQWSFVAGHPEPVINTQPVGAHLTKLQYDKRSLLEAAVRNFTAGQTKADGQPRGNRLTSARQGMIKAPSATEFAKLCRDLDLGSAYQQHLDQVLNGPVTDDKPAWTVPSLLADWSRHAMLLDAYKARYSAGLNEQELALIVKLCANHEPQDKACPVKPQRLSLLDCDLQQIVVIDESHNEGRLLLYVPGDPNGAWSAFSSLRKLANELGRRLRSQAYQTFFRRFVRRRDSHAFYSIVVPAYEDLAIWANISLDERLEPYTTPFFPGLADARIEQIKDDAKMIVAPVAELDRALQREHDERLAAEGQALLSAAGLFVPVLGEVLLAVSAWEVLGEVYHGIEAWQDNHTRLACKHLLNVATALAVAGATTAAVNGVKTLTARSSVVDNLLPAHLEDGSTKLWDQDITAFRSEAPPTVATCDAAGIFRWGKQAWIEMEGHYYGVRQRTQDGQWQLLPQAGHGPLLQHNRAGAWRLWCEQPAHWDDVHYLFRRLGGHFRELDDERIGWILSIHGRGADDLRGLHVYGRAPDAGLLDSTVRAHLDQRIRDMVRRLRSGQQWRMPSHCRALSAFQVRRSCQIRRWPRWYGGPGGICCRISTSTCPATRASAVRCCGGYFPACTGAPRKRWWMRRRPRTANACSTLGVCRCNWLNRPGRACANCVSRASMRRCIWTRRKTLMSPGWPSACSGTCPVLPRVSACACSTALRPAPCSWRATRAPQPAT